MGYKTGFEGTPAAKANEKKKKKPESKKWFWEKWGERQGDAAADHLLDMHDEKKKKK